MSQATNLRAEFVAASQALIAAEINHLDTVDTLLCDMEPYCLELLAANGIVPTESRQVLGDSIRPLKGLIIGEFMQSSEDLERACRKALSMHSSPKVRKAYDPEKTLPENMRHIATLQGGGVTSDKIWDRAGLFFNPEKANAGKALMNVAKKLNDQFTQSWNLYDRDVGKKATAPATEVIPQGDNSEVNPAKPVDPGNTAPEVATAPATEVIPQGDKSDPYAEILKLGTVSQLVEGILLAALAAGRFNEVETYMGKQEAADFKAYAESLPATK